MGNRNATSVGGAHDATASTEWLDALRSLQSSPPTELILTEVQGLKKENFAITLDGVLSDKECSTLIALTEAIGARYEPALVNIGFGKQKQLDDVRKNMRYMRDDPSLANWIWDRIKPFVPPVKDGRKVVGPNERLRFLKYTSDEGPNYFVTHYDGTYIRPLSHPTQAGDRSYLTLLIYLNGDFEGGYTRFHPGGTLGVESSNTPGVDVEPQAGRILLHDHRILHEGVMVAPNTGTKYVIRTDIMYTSRAENTTSASPPPQTMGTPPPTMSVEIVRQIQTAMAAKGYCTILRGLKEEELQIIETKYGFTFPPDVRFFLSVGVPVNVSSTNGEGDGIPEALPELYQTASDRWHNWHNLVREEVAVGSADDTVTKQISWHATPKGGEHPPNEKLIPLFCHRMIPSVPSKRGNPVFSMHGCYDNIVYGNNLWSWLMNEFPNCDLDSIIPNDWWKEEECTPVRDIPFWSALIG